MAVETPHRATDAAQIEALEQQQDFRFPEAYKDFLLKYNGGEPRKHGFTAQKYGSSILQKFYGIDTGEPVDDIEKKLEVFHKRIPSEFVPIGCDFLGNQLIIGVKEEYAGKVYFWWHEGESDTDTPAYDNIFPIVGSFPLFLESLEEITEREPSEIERILLEGNRGKIQALIGSGWDFKSKNLLHQNPVTFLAVRGKAEAITLLLEHGADTEGALELAMLNRHDDVMRILLEAGVNPDGKGNQGVPHLHNAIMDSNVQAVKLLLEYEADARIEDEFDDTPLKLAELLKARGEENMNDIIALIRQYSSHPAS